MKILAVARASISKPSFYHFLKTIPSRQLRDTTGLLGPAALVKRDPFVDRYRDHSGEYWEVTDGRSRRIQMIGIETQRPLFVYQQDESGKFKALDYVAGTGSV